MKSGNPHLLYLYIYVACSIPTTIILFFISEWLAGSSIGWTYLIECITPTLITGLALIIYFLHKRQVA